MPRTDSRTEPSPPFPDAPLPSAVPDELAVLAAPPADDAAAGEDSRASLVGLIVGLLVSVVISAALVLPAAKAGITPGVSPLVVLVGWAIVATIFGPRGRLRFLTIAQVAGSAGAAVTAGVIFVWPAVQLADPEGGFNLALLIVACLSGCLVGWGVVGLTVARYLDDRRLPAPEGTAVFRMIQTAIERPEHRPNLWISLLPGIALGVLFQVLKGVHIIADKLPIVFAQRPDGAEPPPGGVASAPTSVSFDIYTAPVIFGIGGLLPLSTALLLLTGSLVNVGTYAYAYDTWTDEQLFRWVGGAAMLVAVIYSIGSYAITRLNRAKAAAEATQESAGVPAELLKIRPAVGVQLWIAVALGSVGVFAVLAMSGASVLTMVGVGIAGLVALWPLGILGGLLSLQVGSSASPISGTTLAAMAVLSLAALTIGAQGDAIVMIALIVPVATTICVALCAANDSSQDYFAVSRCGFRISNLYWGQLLGLLGGAIAVPVTLYLIFQSDPAGYSEMSFPQARMFQGILTALFGDTSAIPWGAVAVGAGFGVVAVVVEVVGKTRRVVLSSLAFAVGVYLPSLYTSIIAIGALARFAGTKSPSGATNHGLLAAAGLIAGGAAVELFQAGMVLNGFEFVDVGAGLDPDLPTVFGILALVVLSVLLWLNFSRRDPQPFKPDAASTAGPETPES
jgi:uncharacterized oligopeptide transporter (OPT) family protein